MQNEARPQPYVGARVRVYWPLDAVWYTGTIIEIDPSDGTQKVLYDDGECEELRLHKEHYQILEPNSRLEPDDALVSEHPHQGTCALPKKEIVEPTSQTTSAAQPPHTPSDSDRDTPCFTDPLGVQPSGLETEPEAPRGENNSNGMVKPVAVENTKRPRRRTALGVAAAVLAVLPDKAKQMGAGPVWTGKGAAAVYKHLKAASSTPVAVAARVASQNRPTGSLSEEPATSAMPATPAASAKSVWASAACTPLAKVSKPEPAGSVLAGTGDSCVDGSNRRSDDTKRVHPQEHADVEMPPVGDVGASPDAVELLVGPQGSKRAAPLEAPLMEEVPETKRARATCSALLASSTGATSSTSRGAEAGHGRGPQEGLQTPSEKLSSTSSMLSSLDRARPLLCREMDQTSDDRGLVADTGKQEGTLRLEVEGEDGASVVVEAQAVDANYTQSRRKPEAATLVSAHGRRSSSRKALQISEMAEEVGAGKPEQSGPRQAHRELGIPADTGTADSPPAIIHFRLTQEGGATMLGGEASCPPAASGIEEQKRIPDGGEDKVAGSNGEVVDDMHEWLASLGLAKYAGLLQQQQVSMRNISKVTLDDLRKLPIYAIGPRRKLMNAIDSLSSQSK